MATRTLRICTAAAVLWALAAGMVSGQTRPEPVAARPGAPSRVPGNAASSPIDQWLRAEVGRLNARLSGGEAASALFPEATRLLDVYLAFDQADSDGQTLVQIVGARRVISQLGDAKNEAGRKLTPFLLANPEMASTLAFALRAEDNVPQAYAVLAGLQEKFPSDVEDKAGAAALAAAICVVYDKPPVHPTRGRRAAPGLDPNDVFGYFRSNAARMLFHDRLPVEMLVHMVDLHASIDEAQWALRNYAGNQNVGKLFDSIVYDTAALKLGKEKKIDKEAYTLPNIKRVGGVCAEQAYFASEVAKSIGVPSVFITGDGTDVDHAWVGYLRAQGDKVMWDFSEGRFGEFKHTQGRVTDPQTGRQTSDAFVSLSEWVAAAPKGAARLAAARTDAAARLMTMSDKPEAFPPKWPGGEALGETAKESVRHADTAAALEMLRSAVTACAGHEPAWQLLASWSGKGVLNETQKREWSEAVVKMAGAAKPDFAMAMLSPMFASIEDAQEQNRMWDWVASQFHQRPDLVSRARVAQAQCWEKAGDHAKAWAALQDVITRFANDGQGVLVALSLSEGLLKKTGKDAAALGLYEDAFRRVMKPASLSPAFATQSNYYRVGYRYAELLMAAGRTADASRVRRQIGVIEEPAGK